MKYSTLVTIFIPVYNGEKYLTKTLESVISQTYSKLEILLVDDSSTDNSLNILKHYQEQDSRIKVFEKENSGMVPKVLNYIIPHIKGDFFFYASQDDILSLNLIENLIVRYKETEADSILPDMEYYHEDKTNNKRIIGFHGNRDVILSGLNAFKASINWNIHGFALFNTKLIKQEIFPEDAFDSDEYITRKMFLNSNSVAFSKGVFYYRQDNSNAITKTFSKKNFYRLNTLLKLYKLSKEAEIGKQNLFNQHYYLLHQYYTYRKQYKTFNFKSEKEKNEINSFLSNFKKMHFTNTFYLEYFSYALLRFKLKYIAIILITKTAS